jgi:hypothetical protein
MTLSVALSLERPIATDASYEAANSACSASFHSPKGEPAKLAAATWSHAVVYANATDAWATISYNPVYAHISGKVATIRVPANAVPAPPSAAQGGDARLYIIDPTDRYVDEMWKAEKQTDGNWTVGSYRRNDLTGSGIGTGGVRAYGGSGLGGLIRKGELNGALSYATAPAAIQHAIPHAVPIAVTRPLERNGWVWPAISNDVAGKPDPEYVGVVPMGQFVAIPPDVDVTKLGLQTPQGLELAFAMQQYGAYLVDSSDNYSWYAETAAAGDVGQINDALNGHMADSEVLQHALVCVAGNTPDTPGGGPLTAPRRTCWAPWLPSETPIPGACVLHRP